MQRSSRNDSGNSSIYFSWNYVSNFQMNLPKRSFTIHSRRSLKFLQKCIFFFRNSTANKVSNVHKSFFLGTSQEFLQLTQQNFGEELFQIIKVKRRYVTLEAFLKTSRRILNDIEFFNNFVTQFF